jgi:hypothetical protein
MKRKFAKLKGVAKAADEYAQQHNRRPFVFGFTTEQGSALHRRVQAVSILRAKPLAIWHRLCDLCAAVSIEDVKRLDEGRKKRKPKRAATLSEPTREKS